MADEVARYRYGVVWQHHQPDYLELQWLPTTASMADEDWMTGLMIRAPEAEAAKASAILIDATEFRHTFGDREGAMAWRDDHVIPRYNRAGVKKFAFLMPESFPGPTAETGAEPQVDGRTAEFPTQWFGSRENAIAWLSS